MRSFRIPVVFLSVWLAASAFADDKSSATVKDEIKALVKEDAKKNATKPAPPLLPAKTANPDPVSTTVAPTSTAVVAPPATPDSATAAVSPKPVEPPTTMPTVEVNKRKITVLDHELAEQDKNIAREAKNAKSTETDRALNAPAITVPILGGESAKVRTGLAQERIELMETEKDLTEAIAHAKTKQEKAELKKQLDDIRTMRRTLDQPR
jgi:hypothetical protein